MTKLIITISKTCLGKGQVIAKLHDYDKVIVEELCSQGWVVTIKSDHKENPTCQNKQSPS